MPLSTKLVGGRTEPVTHRVDARWIMAYASALDDGNPRMMDTKDHAPVIAHPVFPVCVEWPLVLAAGRLPGAELMTRSEAARGVHSAHDLHIHRPIRDGDVLSTTAEVIGVEALKPGACQITHLVTRDAAGSVVCETFQQGISRGVAVDGDATRSRPVPPLPTFGDPPSSEHRVDVPLTKGAANVYTECARIFNPIHSDRAVALAAGLPDIILHGTATLALGVSAVVNHCFDGQIERVGRLGGRFSAMVLMPSTIQVLIRRFGHEGATFVVVNAEGREAIQHGFVQLRG